MLNNSGYYNKSDDDLPSDSSDLLVKSCGHYKLISREKMHTVRATGRRDYQLLYVADGSAHFTLNHMSYDVDKGGVVIYRPNEPQNYYYILPEKPDVYWIHFTGLKAEQILETLGFTIDHPLQLQTNDEVCELFEKIITELRLNRYLGTEMAETYLHQLLVMVSRYSHHDPAEKQFYNTMWDAVLNQFNQDYQKNINIAEYADKMHISCSWFIREFKKYVGCAPKQYITNLRIQHAKELLNNRYFLISDVAELVGYENQLYFSRIFKKCTGMSPSEYRESGRC